MKYCKVVCVLFVLILCYSCGERGASDGGLFPAPKFGFSHLIEGKSVKMVDVFDSEFTLGVSDSFKLAIQFKELETGEQLIVNDWIYNYEKAIKYKRYYFLHHLVDSSFYEIVVVGRYFSKYYVFNEIEQQNLSVWNSIRDSTGAHILIPLKIDSLSSWNVVIKPDDKKIIKQYYKALFKNTYLRKEVSEVESIEIAEIDTAFFDENRLEDIEDLKIFPNPVSGEELNIKTDLLNIEGAKLSITNLTGEKIHCEQFPGYKSIKVNVGNLQSGSYFAIIEGGNKKLTSQFIVIK